MSRVLFPRVSIDRYYTRVTVIFHFFCGRISGRSDDKISFVRTGFDHIIMFVRAGRNYLLSNGTVRLANMEVVSTQAWGWGTVWGIWFGNRWCVPYARILSIWIVDSNAVNFFGDSPINSFEWGRFWGIGTFICIFLYISIWRCRWRFSLLGCGVGVCFVRGYRWYLFLTCTDFC